jgi:hypothetical protein
MPPTVHPVMHFAIRPSSSGEKNPSGSVAFLKDEILA